MKKRITVRKEGINVKRRYGVFCVVLAFLCLLSSCSFRITLKEIPETPASQSFTGVAPDLLNANEQKDGIFWASTCDFEGSKLSPRFFVESREGRIIFCATPLFPGEEGNLRWQSMVEEALEGISPSRGALKLDFTMSQVRSLYRLDAFFSFPEADTWQRVDGFCCYWNPKTEKFASFLSFFSEFPEYQPYLAEYLRKQCEGELKEAVDFKKLERFLRGNLSFDSFEAEEDALIVTLDETNLLKEGALIRLSIPYSYCDGSIVAEKGEQWKQYRPAQPGEKVIALTFDDGPKNSNTNAILDVLEKYQVKATFFAAGHRVDDGTGKTLRRILSLGSQIGNHSFTHPNFHLMTMEEVWDEINRTQEAVYKQTGVYPTCLRPPYGNLHIDRCSEVDLFVILWNEDTLDWEHRNSQTLIDTVKAEASAGDIVLMHDSQATVTNGESVEEIVVWLLQEGYRLVTVEELFDLRSQEPAGHKYFSQKEIR